MKKHYIIMGAFALDYFMEEVHPELDMNDNISLLVLDKANEIAEKIAKVIESNCECDENSKKEIEELFLNDVADYFYHFMFVQDVTGLDDELEKFIKVSYGLAGELAIADIIENMLKEHGIDIIINHKPFYDGNK